jgi:hypothetical protein
MKTIYDVITLIIFAGLVVLFLQRSMERESSSDKAYYYLPAAVGCAVANYLGNHGQDALAVYATVVLKPFTKLS